MKTVKFIRFQFGNESYYGRLDGEKIFALNGDIFGEYEENGKEYYLNEVKLLTPCEPSKAICVGLNYKRHAAELNLNVPEEPVIFMKPTTSMIGPHDDVVYWPIINRLDYEAELVVVIGKNARNIKPEEASDYIFGYTVGNDVTARDLQQKDGQWTRAKSFDTFLPFGPCIVRGIDPSELKVQAFLNGEIVQDGDTSDLIFSIPFIVSYISKVMTLLPGDIIMTGTPEGVGPMQIGDTIEIRIEQLGSIVNRIVEAK
ncbi:MAG: fumarylacetoacetate hydrolase family protein [Desulfitobacterium hafniense]|nr:fumarylacetoacetate hydrolase family protein [Desulfitobacterium hafniense]